ncbi:MAG: Efflux pump periplasmic linker BepF [uncultured Bacteroidota bacterium]|jgi:RND family efflux transporter MFP subunit|nr:MAG: Efflux pump periplasmic linker BepF [uncultured Bacteroidetes bacterium]
MKKSILFIGLSLLMFRCGQPSEVSKENVSSPSSLEALQVQKDKLTQQINTATTALEEVNAAIDQMTNNEKRVLVTALAVEAVNFEHTIEVQANVKTRQNLDLYPEYNGKLVSIYVKEGQSVKKGALLAKIDDAGLKEQLDQIELQLNLAETTFERTERLWNQKIGSEMMYLEAKTRYEAQKKQLAQMRRQLAKTKIYAPFNGTIDQVFANQGANVAPGVTPILRIVNLNSMYVEADVPENYLTSVTKGSKAVVEIPVLGQSQITSIRQTGSYIQPSNRTFRVEAPLDNPNGDIKPNLVAKLNVIDYTNPEALMVPRRILRQNAEGVYFVFALSNSEGENSYAAEQRFVELGKSKNEMIEITQGISQGDLLIDEGVSLLEPNQKVKRIEQ